VLSPPRRPLVASVSHVTAVKVVINVLFSGPNFIHLMREIFFIIPSYRCGTTNWSCSHISNFLVIPKLLQLHDHNYGSLNLWSSEKQELCWADSPNDENILGVLGIYIYMYIIRIALDTPIHFFLSDSELSSPSLLWSWSSGHPTQTKKGNEN